MQPFSYAIFIVTLSELSTSFGLNLSRATIDPPIVAHSEQRHSIQKCIESVGADGVVFLVRSVRRQIRQLLPVHIKPLDRVQLGPLERLEHPCDPYKGLSDSDHPSPPSQPSPLSPSPSLLLPFRRDPEKRDNLQPGKVTVTVSPARAPQHQCVGRVYVCYAVRLGQ